MMGADYYESPDDVAADRTAGRPPLGIGDGTVIEGAIVDKNCRIGRNVRIANERGLETTDETPQAMVRDGIVVVPKDAGHRRWLVVRRALAQRGDARSAAASPLRMHAARRPLRTRCRPTPVRASASHAMRISATRSRCPR